MDIQSLPLEIIRRIASFVPCDSIFGLLGTSWKLHNACYDHLVFKQIIEINNARNLSQWNPSILSSNTSASHCARIAVSDMMAWQWVSDQQTSRQNAAIRRGISDWWGFEDAFFDRVLISGDESETAPCEGAGCKTDRKPITFSQLCKWALYLSVLQHPFLVHMNLNDLVRQAAESGIQSPGKVWSTGHILTCAFLAQGHHYLSDNLVDIFQEALYATTFLHDSMVTEHIRSSCEYNWPALLVCPILEYCTNGGVNGKLLPPLPSAMFGATKMYENPPLLLGGDTQPTEPGAHLSPMLTQEFVEEGEWVGYYTNSTDPVNFQLNLPMTGIHFRVSNGICPNLVPLFSAHPFQSFTSEGSDSLGTFKLEGHISSLDGVIRMKHTYSREGPNREWKGRMTPFGIVCTWEFLGFIWGYVWLWKREWSPKVPEWLSTSSTGS